jgi:hypothetical protein
VRGRKGDKYSTGAMSRSVIETEPRGEISVFSDYCRFWEGEKPIMKKTGTKVL